MTLSHELTLSADPSVREPSVPESPVPEVSTSESTASESTASESPVPEVSTSESTASESTASESTASEPVNRYTETLRGYMQARQVNSFAQLSQQSGLSRSAVDRLRKGQVLQMEVYTLVKLSMFLQVDLDTLIRSFSPESTKQETGWSGSAGSSEETFHRSALQILEPWLLQWSAVAYAAQNNPQLTAAKLLPLLRPLEELLQAWGVTVMGRVGEVLPYNPIEHQVMESDAREGDAVRVRYSGYRYQTHLLHRAKVVRIEN